MKRDAASATQYSTDDLLNLEPSAVMGLLEQGRITRRDVFKALSAAGVAAFGLQMLDDSALAKEELKMIIWEGYADDKYRIPFEEANDCTVSYTEAGTGDEMFAQMKDSDGKNYDMVSASSDLPKRLYDAGPAGRDRHQQADQLQRSLGPVQDARLHHLRRQALWRQLCLGPDAHPLRTRTRSTTAPTSWNALLDEQYKGKISTWNYPLQIAQYARSSIRFQMTSMSFRTINSRRSRTSWSSSAR